MEPKNEPVKFIEKQLTGNEPARCIDGRAAVESEQGPQMLGGSLHPLIVKAVSTDSDFTQDFVEEGLNTLKGKGFKTGVHHGSHKHPEEGKSDCGAVDRLKDIITKAIGNEYEIKRRIAPVYESLGLDPKSLEKTYGILRYYSPEKIKISGESFIQTAVDSGAVIEELEKDHVEEVAFINLKQGTTFDTRKANSLGHQGFNLDLHEAIKEATALEVDPHIARDLSVILYQATEMVLVEDKGKPALPVVVYK